MLCKNGFQTLHPGITDLNAIETNETFSVKPRGLEHTRGASWMPRTSGTLLQELLNRVSGQRNSEHIYLKLHLSDIKK